LRSSRRGRVRRPLKTAAGELRGALAVRLMQLRTQPGDLAARGVLMERALARRSLQRASSCAQLLAGRCRVAALDRVAGKLYGTAHARFDRAVTLLAFEVLAMAFLRRRMNGNMRHDRRRLTAPEIRVNKDSFRGTV